MAHAAFDSADTVSPDLLQAHSGSHNDLFGGISPVWLELQAPSDSRNEEFDQNWDWDKEFENLDWDREFASFTNELRVQAPSDSRNEQFENLDWDRELASFTNEILSDAGTEVTGTVPVQVAAGQPEQ